MRKKNDIFTPPAKPWQPRWWREEPERWRWGGTIAIVFMLIGVFAYQNPDIWQNTPAQQVAEQPANENAAPQLAKEQEQLTIINEAAIPEPPPVQPEVEKAPEAEAAMPADVSAQQQVLSMEDSEPQGMQELEAATAAAVSAAPASWQQPGYGEWSRDYGYALDPTQGDYRFHRGRDMELSVGSPVFAAASGRVLRATEDAAWGGVIILEHGGGWHSIYKGVKPEVKAGEELVAGEQIGEILASPTVEQAQPSHLHFEMELNGEGQNPSQWL